VGGLSLGRRGGLRLTLLLDGHVMADYAAADGAGDPVMSGIMARNAADDRAGKATGRRGGRGDDKSGDAEQGQSREEGSVRCQGFDLSAGAAQWPTPSN